MPAPDPRQAEAERVARGIAEEHFCAAFDPKEHGALAGKITTALLASPGGDAEPVTERPPEAKGYTDHTSSPHPPDAICPAHEREAMNIYQGGSHRNYSCQAVGCDFQAYRYPCPDCGNYYGGLSEDQANTTRCRWCAAPVAGEAGALEAALRDALVFQRKTWPHATPESCASHLAKEAEELKESARDPHEVADAMLLVSHLAHLAGIDLSKAIRDKLEILRARKWGEPDADGVVEHVRSDCAPPASNAASWATRKKCGCFWLYLATQPVVAPCVEHLAALASETAAAVQGLAAAELALAEKVLAWRAAFRDWSMGKHLGDAKREMRGYQAMMALHDEATGSSSDKVEHGDA